MVKIKRILLIVVSFLFILCYPSIVQAKTSYEYVIIPEKTSSMINTGKTTAEINHENNEITLKKILQGRDISFLGEDYDYVVLNGNTVTHYRLSGGTMNEFYVQEIAEISNPLAVVASGSYPDMIVANPEEIVHYSFDGADKIENPSLSIQGFSYITNISSRGIDTAVLSSEGLDYYAFTGLEIARVGGLSIDSSKLNNPLDVALFSDNYNVAIMEKDKIRIFNFNGDNLTENTLMAISSGGEELKSISYIDGKLTCVRGNDIISYLYDGSDFQEVGALSLIGNSYINNPTCVSLRPESHDLIVSDDTGVQYFMFDGTNMVYNPSLSKTISGLSSKVVGYVKEGVVVSNTINDIFTSARVMASCTVPENTYITWLLSTDGGSNWIYSWRIRGTAGGQVIERSIDDSGTIWGNVTDYKELWEKFSVKKNNICWKAELKTEDESITPVIKASSNPETSPAVILEVNKKLEIVLPPQEPIGGGCHINMTPKIKWNYTDDSEAGLQEAYMVKIVGDTGEVYWYPEKTEEQIEENYTSYSDRKNNYHIMLPYEDESTPSNIFKSGEFKFQVKVKVFDGVEWSNEQSRDICFVAMERARIADLAAPAGINQYEGIEKGAGGTPVVIKKEGMGEEGLPATKAGGMVTLLVDTIGNVNLDKTNEGTMQFIYKTSDNQIIKGGPIEVKEKYTSTYGTNKNSIYEIKFFTDSSKKINPDDNVVGMILKGNGGDGTVGGTAKFNISKEEESGYKTKGIVSVDGTLLGEWTVVLNGSKQ